LFLVFTGWCNEKLYSSFYYGVISLWAFVCFILKKYVNILR
jgi:hypothetical protein